LRGAFGAIYCRPPRAFIYSLVEKTTLLLPAICHRNRLSVCLAMVLCSALPGFPKSNLQVVVVPVADMYAQPTEKSAVVSQALYASNVTLLSARGEWSRIQTPDRYRGWTPSRYLRLVQVGNGYGTAGPTIQIESLFANVYAEPDVTRHKPILTLPYEVRLEVVDETRAPPAKEKAPAGWLQVRLPVMRNAWIQSSDVVSDPQPFSIAETIDLAKRFLGLPYLWGGRSSFGFDCSGFTQMLLRARGANLPRDADQQAAWNGLTAVERGALEPGDLLFFGSSPGAITHTGMYLGDGQFIHDSTNGHPVVQISRLEDDPWTRLLVACRRLKP
jgi:gamma-D-glutamyl-L-lysine dipeptidyl-peptidase